MNIKVCILAIILLTSLISSAKFGLGVSDSAKNQEIIIDDGYKSTNENEIVIDDASFQNKIESNSSSDENLRSVTQTASDGSQIDITYDGFGNKTETRTFNNNLLLKLILLRTGVDGSKKVFVYAKNGEVKSLKDDVLDRVMTAPSSELANLAGIYEGYKKPIVTENNQPLSDVALKPFRDLQFPTKNQSFEQTQTPEKNEEISDESEKPQASENKKDIELAAIGRQKYAKRKVGQQNDEKERGKSNSMIFLALFLFNFAQINYLLCFNASLRKFSNKIRPSRDSFGCSHRVGFFDQSSNDFSK